MEFPKQEHCSGLPFPSPGDLPDPGIELVFLVSPALAGGFFTTSTTLEGPLLILLHHIIILFQSVHDGLPIIMFLKKSHSYLAEALAMLKSNVLISENKTNPEIMIYNL